MLTVKHEEELSVSVTSLNGLLLKRMIVAGANELNNQKQLVDSLNVFPVPDGDTGTNMSLTALAAAKETEKSHSLAVGEIARLASSGALRGARGNSGVITSQLFRGFAKALEGMEEAGVKELATAVRKGVKTAYKAVMKPKEGTILTVARACADSAEKAAQETDDIEEFLRRVIEAAEAMLLETTEMLPVLKQAGVVDAGGKGLICILQGAYKNMRGEEIELSHPEEEIPEKEYVALASVENDSIRFGYCTEFLIHTKQTDERVQQKLKSFLNTIGDSIVCVADDDLIKIHVHTDHPGLAIERALTLGSLTGLKIDNMREQHTNIIDFANHQEEKKEESKKWKHCGFVAITAGSGMIEIFKNLGVDEIIEGGQTMNPSTEDILNAVARVQAENVIILPNNKNIILAAEQAAKLAAEKKVFVVPSKTMPEGIAAMFHFEEGDIQQSIAAMKNSMEAVQTAEVTYAVRDTMYEKGEIKEGDILGIAGGKMTVVAKDIAEGTKELVSQLITEDTDIVSIYYGEDVTEEAAKEIAEFIEKENAHCEVEVHFGGQPLYYYIISVE